MLLHLLERDPALDLAHEEQVESAPQVAGADAHTACLQVEPPAQYRQSPCELILVQCQGPRAEESDAQGGHRRHIVGAVYDLAAPHDIVDIHRGEATQDTREIPDAGSNTPATEEEDQAADEPRHESRGVLWVKPQ